MSRSTRHITNRGSNTTGLSVRVVNEPSLLSQFYPLSHCTFYIGGFDTREILSFMRETGDFLFGDTEVLRHRQRSGSFNRNPRRAPFRRRLTIRFRRRIFKNIFGFCTIALDLRLYHSGRRTGGLKGRKGSPDNLSCAISGLVMAVVLKVRSSAERLFAWPST